MPPVKRPDCGAMSNAVDARSDEVEEDAFEWTLSFAGAACPGCNEFQEPGPCAHCDQVVPIAGEPSKETLARIAALGPLAEQAQALERTFDTIGHGGIAISTDQFAAVVSELEVGQTLAELMEIGPALQRLDLNDPRVVGRQARAVAARYLRKVEHLYETAEDLASFAPEGSAREVQTVTLAGCRWGASVVRTVLRVLAAESASDARAMQAELQALLNDMPLTRAMAAIDAMTAEARPDIERRLELVLQRPGPFSDEWGFVDLPSVFEAYSAAELPLSAIGADAKQYFRGLVDPDLPADSAIPLLLGMVAFAGLDRPLRAAQILRRVLGLLKAAYADDPERTTAVLEGATADAALVYGATSRAMRGLKLLAAGEAAGFVDDRAALAQVLGAFLDFAEGPFRTYAWACVRLEGGPDGRCADARPPTLGEMKQRLSAVPGLSTVADMVDSDLRNAAGHSQYHWDPTNEVLRDLRTGRRWTIEELETSVAGLSEAVIGLDAAFACFLSKPALQAKLGIPSPDETRELQVALIEALFAAYGLRVLEITAECSETTLDVDDVRLPQVMPVLGGIGRAVHADVKAIRLRDRGGRVLLTVDASQLREVADAAEDVRDLAIAELCCRIDPDREGRSDSQALALLLLAVGIAPIERVEPFSNGELRRLIRRFEYVRQVADERVPTLVPRLRRVIAAAYGARARRHNGHRDFVRRWIEICMWASQQEPRHIT